MSDVFALCAFKTPLDGSEDALRTVLRAGMPVNIRYGELRDDSDFDSQAGLLHLVCAFAEGDEERRVAASLIDVLFEYGANWMLLDGQNRTPGDIAYERGLNELYDKFVQAGFRSEIVLQKFLEESDDEGEEDGRGLAEEAVEGHNKKFLSDQLSYNEHALTTTEQDGVMMDWETPIMQRSAELIAKPGGTVLNIGFGMGIIDGFIQDRNPEKHYIVEAHPDVLKKMKQSGWYDKPNVVVLEGTWKEQLKGLLDQGIQFDGIYYDTFSEHYEDMLQLFDYVVGLLSFQGVFSYFNGLGADRQVCYDVYKQVAKYNLKDYGLQLDFEVIPLSVSNSTWKNIKREYFKLNDYALPIVTFAGELEEEEGELLQ